MTGAELKTALMDERPVIHNGITYQKITAVIYRREGNGKRVRVSAELLDKNSRDVVIAPAGTVKGVSEKGGQTLNTNNEPITCAGQAHRTAWTVAKYAALTITGILLFRVSAAYALQERGHAAVGGEGLVLFLPVIYYAVSQTVRDIIKDIKSGHRPQFKEENEP